MDDQENNNYSKTQTERNKWIQHGHENKQHYSQTGYDTNFCLFYFHSDLPLEKVPAASTAIPILTLKQSISNDIVPNNAF